LGREKKKAYGSSNSGGGKQEEEEGGATSSSSVVLEFSQVPTRVFSFGFFCPLAFFLSFLLSFLVIPTYSDLLYCCDWKKSVGSFVARLGLYIFIYTLILFFMFAKRDPGCPREGRKGRRQLCEFFL
jgi:hypothetical protein